MIKQKSKTAVIVPQQLIHRYPFLLVDAVLERTETRCVTIKNLSYNEEFFQGHFPGVPIMPGVLIIEVLAQTAAIMGEPEEGSIYMIVGVEKFKFQQQVVPGDQIICTANLIKKKLNLFFVDGSLKVRKPDGTEKICALGTIKCAKVKGIYSI